MVIKRKDGTTLAEVWLQDSSCVNEEIMGEHTAQIDFLSRYPIDLEIGDYIEHEGYIYTLRHKESVTKRETSLGWDYSVLMYSARYELQDVPFFLTDQPEYLKNGDYYTGTASDWLQLIIKNMNREISGWSAGSCVESEWITISFKDRQCSDVLDELCAQLDTEWQVIGRTLSIGRVEYPSNGLTFSQGEGGGFKELKLSSSNQERPVTVLYPYGSDKNLPENYGADYLLLPGGQKVMERNVDKYGRCGMKVQFDVYPKGEFTVTSVMDDLTFTAEGIDFDLAVCLIPDTEVIVSFKSGALAGYDLAIAEDGWDNATKQITVLQNEEENALKVPGDIHISVGDRFALFNLRMPQAYVDKAEEELKQKAEAWLAKNSEKEVRLSAKCDDILFKQNSISVRCGQMVRILSLELDLDKEIRVTKVKRYIENDQPTYRYELTLSDFLDTNGFKELVKEVEDMPDEIKSQTKGVKEYTRRGFRDVMETFDMMFDPEGSYFQDKIKPLAVHTAQVVVGTNSQQFDLIGVTFQPNKDGDPNLFGSTAGKLTHFTIDEAAIREWTIAESLWTLNGSYPYYVYAKCSRTGTTGTILCSTSPIKLEDDPDYYHFWIGVLNTPWDGARSFQPNYGFTEITGQYITTGTIKDKSGQSYFDLTNNKFRIGGEQGSLDWNVTKKDQLTLKGCLYQSPAGVVDYPEVDRGLYSSSLVYYPGDKVYYKGNVYKCIQQTDAGIVPTNTNYWKMLVSKGDDSYTYSINPDVKNIALDANGNATPSSYTCTCYKNGQGTRTTETAKWYAYRSNDNTNWGTAYAKQETYSSSFSVTVSSDYKYYKIVAQPYDGIECYAFAFIVKDGEAGAQGLQGPATPFRGLYDSNKTYYGNTNRTDIVYTENSYGNKTYYRARTDAAESSFSGKSPTNTSYWNQFGAQFDNVATDLLLARKILASEINTTGLKAEKLDCSEGKIANFTIETGQLTGGDGAGITVYKKSGSTTYQAKLGWGTRSSNGGSTIFWADNASIGKLHCDNIVCYDSILDGCSFNASSGGLGVLVGGSGLSGNGIWGQTNGKTGNLYINSGAPSSALVKITNCSCSDASDERIKTIFYDVPNVLDKLEGISAFYYTYKEDEDKILKIGVSAQAVREVFPEAVTLIMPDSSDSYYGVNYVQLLTAVGINGLKELHAKVKTLEERIETLESSLNKEEQS